MDDCNRDPALKPWAVSAAGYPRGGEAGQKFRFLVRYSVLAPSGHNTQPWLFKFQDKAIELHADRARALPVIDPDDRELIISCGAALETSYVAMRQFGHDGAVRLAPHPGDRDLLARVSLEDGDPPDQDENELFAAIPRRRTNRQAFEARDIPGELADQLDADADALEVSPCLVRGADRAAVADLVTEGDRTRMADKRFRRELAAWVHPNRGRTRDGMRGCGFGVGDLMSYGGPVVIRSFDLGRGRALQRVLLRARANGVWSSYLNQPIEAGEMRPKLDDRANRRVPSVDRPLRVRDRHESSAAPPSERCHHRQRQAVSGHIRGVLRFDP